MAIGPFSTYVPPGVYSRTLTEANVASLVAGLRIPALIGVAQEELEQLDLEMVRGSSSTLDQQIVNEDVTLRWIVDDVNPTNPTLGANDGTKTRFKVRNAPLVDGQGFGRTSNDVRSVTVTVDGTPVAVGAIRGASGEVVLQVPPASTSVVRCTYFFHRGDTAFTDDVSDQVTSTSATIITPGFEPFNIVTGSNDTLKIRVDGGVEYTVTFLPGSTTTAASLKTQIDAGVIAGLSTSVFVANDGTNHLQLTAQTSIEIGSGSTNGILGLSNGQKTVRNQSFRVYQIPMVDGTSGGITTTDPAKVVVKVNNTQVIPTSVDGTHGLVTLGFAPPPGSSVVITYWANTWQDTFDYLPNTLVTNVMRAGISPNRSDYIQGQDFVVSNPSPDVSIIHWGASYSISSTLRTPGAEPLDESQIVPTLVDDKLWLAPCTAFMDTSVIPARASTTVFVLPEVPTTGNGRDTTLGSPTYSNIANSRTDLVTNRPDLVVARVGRTLRDALGRPAVKVVAVDGAARKIVLKDPLPPDWNVYATFNYSRLVDDTYIITNKTPGPIGQGQYEVFSSLFNSNLYQVRFGSKGGGLVETVQWPRGVEQVPDAMHVGGTPVGETVTVTFGQAAATNAVFTNKGAQPFSFYSPSSATWRTLLNGNPVVSTNLVTASRAYLVSQPVQLSGGNITITSSSNDTFNLTVDGVDISVTLTAGTRTPAQIATEINAAIDADPAFSSTTHNFLCTAIPGPGTSYTFFVIRSYSTPAALPGGFDHQSYVRIRQGTAESTLGFTTFQRADGTTGAINKPATLVGLNAEAFVFTSGLNDVLKVRINGVDFQVTINPSSTTATLVVADINAVISSQGVASVGTLGNLNHVRITSNTNSEQSSVVILNGSANATLGLNEGDFASQSRVTVQEVVNRLLATPNITVTSWGAAGSPGTAPTANSTGAVAYPTTIGGQVYLTLESLVVGSTSSIAFGTGSNSAFNILTGTQITPGTDGDNGEDATDNFVVTSTNPYGSAGTGIPGQTYTDARTGLRFTVLSASGGSYHSGGHFSLDISQTFNVNPGVPFLAIPGLETIVTNTVNVGVNDTSNIQTFNPSGLEPKNGDFYFISYRFLKQDYSTRIYRQFKTIEANYGKLTAENRVTLGAYLAILNGAVLVGIKQVHKIPNTNQASSQQFIEAINNLATPLPGNIKPDLLVPLSTDTAVYAALTQHCEVMSNIRNQSERMGFIGFASGTSPTNAQTVARSLFSQRIVAFYPDSAVITLSNELGETFETLVDGTFFAAAASGAVCSPAVDVATPYTRRRIQGFTRIPRILDPVEANQTAVAGVTLLEDLDPIVRIRQGLTTNMTSILTRLPTVTQIADYVSLSSRSVLDSFVGTKFLASRTNEVEVSMTALFNQLIQQEIVAAFTGISAVIDPEDPTILRAEAYFQPIFPLLYLILTFNLRARI
jgi:hypothetical protein